jgi:phytoene dehydrogenase-like protein
MSPEQLGADRPNVSSQVPGLYFVGHWARPGGGITPVIVSAMEVAHRIHGTTDRGDIGRDPGATETAMPLEAAAS